MVLLVQRGRPPHVGRWSVPGGRVHFGEPLADAVVREVSEETGLEVHVERLAGSVERIGADPEPYHYVIFDFFVSESDPGAVACAGDDAADVRWVPVDAFGTIELVDGLAEFFTSVGVGNRLRG